MKLQVTLALLCMAVCFNLVNCLNCIRSAGASPSEISTTTVDCGASITECVMYKKASGNYHRDCADNTHACNRLSLGTDDQCAQCNKKDCNKGAFTTCYDYKGEETADPGKKNICPSAVCIMYKQGNNYIRDCTAKTGDCTSIRHSDSQAMCAECNTPNCNEKKFTTCYEYNETDAAITGKANICPSGTCIMYKEGNKYIRGCTTTKGTCQAPKSSTTITLCAECSSENCNKGAFKTCHEYNGDDAVLTGSQSPPVCPSDTCIMYKQGTKYIRGCVDAKQSCAALMVTSAILCSECTSVKNCNSAPFVRLCYAYNGPSATHVGNYQVPCSSGKCLAYKEAKTNNYVRTCETDLIDCKKLKDAQTAHECVFCETEACNNKPIKLECYDYSGPSRTDLKANGGSHKTCDTGACIMYKETGSGHYKRGCVDATTTCSNLKTAATLCAECSEEKCNKDPFHDPLMCYVNSGKSTTDLGTPTLCESGTCLSHKDGDNYVRACQKSGGDTANKNPCITHNCNNGAFECNCHVYEGDSITDTGEKLGTCKSGKCIMYKDSKTGKYTRSCVEGEKTCAKLTKTATQCAECSEEKCNRDAFVAFKAASTFSLDVKMAAIGLAGSLMIFRSL